MANKDQTEKKQSGKLTSLVIPLVIVTLAAVGSGWFVGTSATSRTMPIHEKVEMPKDDSGESDQDNASGKMIMLDSILAELRSGENVWLRLDLAIIPTRDGSVDGAETLAQIRSDIIAMITTLRMKHISGPSGLLHLKEDLLDRARLTTQGKVKEVLIMSLIAE